MFLICANARARDTALSACEPLTAVTVAVEVVGCACASEREVAKQRAAASAAAAAAAGRELREMRTCALAPPQAARVAHDGCMRVRVRARARARAHVRVLASLLPACAFRSTRTSERDLVRVRAANGAKRIYNRNQLANIYFFRPARNSLK